MEVDFSSLTQTSEYDMSMWRFMSIYMNALGLSSFWGLWWSFHVDKVIVHHTESREVDYFGIEWGCL